MFCYGLKKHIGAYIAVLGETETVSQKMNIKMTDENVGSGNANWDWSDGLQLPENTTMSIYGYAKLDVIYTDTDGGGKYFLVPKDIPLNSEQAYLPNNSFIMHARESRMGFNSSTDTSWGNSIPRLKRIFTAQKEASGSATPITRDCDLPTGNLATCAPVRIGVPLLTPALIRKLLTSDIP